jgi:hypothetical protein
MTRIEISKDIKIAIELIESGFTLSAVAMLEGVLETLDGTYVPTD